MVFWIWGVAAAVFKITFAWNDFFLLIRSFYSRLKKLFFNFQVSKLYALESFLFSKFEISYIFLGFLIIKLKIRNDKRLVARFYIFICRSIRVEIEVTDSKRETEELRRRYIDFYDDMVHFMKVHLSSDDREFIILVYEAVLFYSQNHGDAKTMCSLMGMISAFLSADASVSDSQLAFVSKFLLELSLKFQCVLSGNN